MKKMLSCVMGLTLLSFYSGCSNLDFAGTSVSDVIGNETAEYVETGVDEKATLRQQRLAQMVTKWESQRHGLGSQDYILGEDDVLAFSIFALESPETTSEFEREITKDGTVFLPLVGDVTVAGMTAREATQAVRDIYDGKYIRNPRLSISVSSYKSSPVVVSGAVTTPGIYYLSHNNSSVLEMLSMANGLTEDSGRNLMIVRTRTTPTEAKDESAAETTATDSSPEEGDETNENYDFSVFSESVANEEAGDESHENRIAIDSTEDQDPTHVEPEDATGEVEKSVAEKKRQKRGGFGGLFKKKQKDEDALAPDAYPAPAGDVETNRLMTAELEVKAPAPVETAPESSDENADMNETETIVVDLRRLVDEGDLSQNVTVIGGDLITVPTRKTEYVYVLGYVGKPGAIKIEKENKVRALWAVAQVGGLNSSARPQNCMLVREKNLKRMKVDLRAIARGSAPPLYMQPGDTLIVGSSRLMKIVEYIKPTASAGANISPLP